jgi:3-hydroxyacyl-CoA dehydrogenase/enoyl-CoA hydratase/3-hydroxybutyryl-CoA epimerase
VRRLVLRMAAEAFLAVQEGVPQRQSDVDAATVLGIGFPDFRGGVLRHARELGIDKVIDDLHELAGECGQRYRPCTLLHEMKGAEPCQRTSNARNLGPPSS